MSKTNTTQKDTEGDKPVDAVDNTVVATNPYCGIIMPISASGEYSATHWERVREIISEAIRDAKHQPRIVSDGNNSSIIHARIVTNIYQDDIVVCDVSNMNPNVMLEFGLRLASQKPIIVIKDSITKYSFDASPIEYIEYPRDLNYYDILEFKNKLSQAINDSLTAVKRKDYKSFLDHFSIPNLKLSTVKTVEVDQVQAITILLDKISKIEDFIANDNTIQRKSPLQAMLKNPVKFYGGGEYNNASHNMIIALAEEIYGFLMNANGQRSSVEKLKQMNTEDSKLYLETIIMNHTSFSPSVAAQYDQMTGKHREAVLQLVIERLRVTIIK